MPSRMFRLLTSDGAITKSSILADGKTKAVVNCNPFASAGGTLSIGKKMVNEISHSKHWVRDPSDHSILRHDRSYICEKSLQCFLLFKNRQAGFRSRAYHHCRGGFVMGGFRRTKQKFHSKDCHENDSCRHAVVTVQIETPAFLLFNI